MYLGELLFEQLQHVICVSTCDHRRHATATRLMEYLCGMLYVPAINAGHQHKGGHDKEGHTDIR